DPVAGEGVGRARGRGYVAADLDEHRQPGRRGVAGARLQGVGRLVAAVRGQRLGAAVAREVDRVLTAAEGVAAQDIDGRAHVPARLDLSVGTESGLCEARIHHAQGVEGRLHPPVDRLLVGGGGGGADVDVAVAGRRVAFSRVVGRAGRLVMGDGVVLDHVLGMVVVTGAPGG